MPPGDARRLTNRLLVTQMRDFRPSNPRRPIDWRWQRSVYLVEHDRSVSSSRDDKWISQGRKFKKSLDNCQNDEQHLSLASASTDLYEAYDLWSDTDECDHKWAIEARLLAREAPEDIARKVGLSPEAIVLYHNMFFDVHDRLGQPDVITNVVIKQSIQAGLSERKYDCLWKLFGYWCGPQVLDMVIHRFAPKDTAEKVVAALKDDYRAQLALKGNLAIRTMPVNWQTQVEIANLFLRMEEMEKGDGSGGGSAEAIVANVDAFFNQLPWGRMARTRSTGNAALDHYDKGGVAIRAEAVTLIGTGDQHPALRSLVDSAASAHFPGMEVEDGNSQDAT